MAVGEEAFRTTKERTNDSSEVWACRTIGRPDIVLSRETRESSSAKGKSHRLSLGRLERVKGKSDWLSLGRIE